MLTSIAHGQSARARRVCLGRVGRSVHSTKLLPSACDKAICVNESHRRVFCHDPWPLFLHEERIGGPRLFLRLARRRCPRLPGSCIFALRAHRLSPFVRVRFEIMFDRQSYRGACLRARTCRDQPSFRGGVCSVDTSSSSRDPGDRHCPPFFDSIPCSRLHGNQRYLIRVALRLLAPCSSSVRTGASGCHNPRSGCMSLPLRGKKLF